ncbi:MAG: hypothetical protein M1838_002738 [Thelocarpon superellum]|nr:MAG: hypothetical protein M1838_002738 [Thelocarpon superellum]
MTENESDQAMASKAVPKFGSFRPKVALSSRGRVDAKREEESLTADHDGPHQAREPRKPSSDVKRHRHSQSSSGHRRRHSPSRLSKVPHRSKEEPKTILSKVELGPTELFKIDTAGDLQNVVYGSIHRYHVPSYYRAGAGSLLGLSPEYRIDRDTGQEKGLLILHRSQSHFSRREKYAFARTERKRPRQLRLKPADGEDAVSDGREDFISLSGPSRKRRRREGSMGSSEEDHHYRSIEGKAKASDQPADRDLQYASESSEADYENAYEPSHASRQRHLELKRRTDADPSDAQAWIDFIDSHDALVYGGQDVAGRPMTLAEKESTSSLKLSLYAKALEKVRPDGDGRVRLLLQRMDEGSRVWDSKQYASEWQKTLRSNSGQIRLWMRYLDFRQTHFTSFLYDDSARASSGTLAELEDRLVYVLLRCTLFLREAGFQEAATATWQACLEMNFFAPEQPTAPGKADDEDFLTAFETFWDSEAPRLGEEGATGWKSYTAEGQDRIPPSSADPVQRKGVLDDAIQDWLTRESSCAVFAALPARTIDDVAEDDPYRVILFSDIKDFLVRVSTDDARFSLLNGFLAFCRLPPLLPRARESTSLSWWTDSFVRSEALDQSDAHLTSVLGGSTSVQPEPLKVEAYNRTKEQPLDCHYHRWPPSVDTLFSKHRWSSALDEMDATYRVEMNRVRAPWMGRALKRLVSIDAGGSDMAELCLAFDRINGLDSLRKTAKALLKQQPTSLRLYNAYALVEWRAGEMDKAESILSTALSLSNTFDETDQLDRILLCRTWAWALLEDGRPQAAWQRLLGFAEGKSGGALISEDANIAAFAKAHPSVLLKARRAFEAGIHHGLSSAHTQSVVHHTDCLALLHYLGQPSSSNALSSALSSYESSLHDLETQSSSRLTTIELLHQARARLLYQHSTTSRAFRPALMRDQLAASIRLFPTNTLFLALYAFNEARFRIDNRVRDLVAEAVLRREQDSSVLGWLFSIVNEAHAAPGSGRNLFSVLALFERAVASPRRVPILHTPSYLFIFAGLIYGEDVANAACLLSAASSPTIWRLYLHYSTMHRTSLAPSSSSHPRTLVWRAIRACPWAKELYLFAFRHLRYVMDDAALREMYAVLSAKELRLHVELPDATR